MTISNEPLSDAKIHVLDEFLMSDSTPEDVLSIDELHGYLTAIICCPRHIWASWHVQQGTPLHVLQELGGWSDYEMVRRYAHLSAEHLAHFAHNLSGGLETSTNLAQGPIRQEKSGSANAVTA